MKNAYLAISYICNENCSFCPCSQKEKKAATITAINELKFIVDEMQSDGISEITLSGGEPTLYPDLPELIAYIQKKGIKATVLSNGEHFSSDMYIYELKKKINMTSLRVITTLHSSKAREHEMANQTIGSFDRSISGLKKLSKMGTQITIKHCITKENYKDLLDFYKYCDVNFNKNVDIQLCSIDYCGISEMMWEREKILPGEVRPFLEGLFDYDMALKKEGSVRKLYCINMPLCSCDPYYWAYLPRRRANIYDLYKDPRKDTINQAIDNVGIHEKYCYACKVKQICCGTYFTAYNVCKSEAVVPYL